MLILIIYTWEKMLLFYRANGIDGNKYKGIESLPQTLIFKPYIFAIQFRRY